MGQRWSMLKNGYLEESEFEGDSVSFSREESQATTEASSSVPVFDRGLCPVCPNDIEIDDDATVVAILDRLLKFKIVINNNLSNLQSREALDVDARKKEKEARPIPATLSTSHFSSVKGSLKDSEIVQVSPAVATCRFRSRKSGLDHKLDAKKEALHEKIATRKLEAKSGAIQPAPLMSLAPSSSPGTAHVMALAQSDIHEEAMVSPLVAKVRVESKLQKVASQPQYSPAQTLMFFQLDRKRKWPSGLPSLAFDCTSCPATHVKLRARTPLERPSEGAVREAVLDLGTGDAMVGRSVRKMVQGRKEICEGRVSCYNAAQRHYQIKYDNGNEEALEWLDLEPYLVADSDHATDPTAVGDRARTRPRYKSVDELYTKHKSPGRVGR